MNSVKGFAFLVLLFIATLFVQNAVAVPMEELEFDFDDADYLGGAAEIEAYMEGLYPSYDITVVGGIVGNGCFNGPLGQDEDDNDHDLYIQAGPSCGTHWFSFSFEEYPIVSVSFDWGVRFNAFHAYADDIEIFSSPGWDCWTSGNSGIIDLLEINPNGVTTLRFSDSCIGEIEVDNLIVVTPIPEPATIALFGLVAALTLLHRRRRL